VGAAGPGAAARLLGSATEAVRGRARAGGCCGGACCALGGALDQVLRGIAPATAAGHAALQDDALVVAIAVGPLDRVAHIGHHSGITRGEGCAFERLRQAAAAEP